MEAPRFEYYEISDERSVAMAGVGAGGCTLRAAGTHQNAASKRQPAKQADWKKFR